MPALCEVLLIDFKLCFEHSYWPGVGDYLHAMSIVGSWAEKYTEYSINVFHDKHDRIDCVSPWDSVLFLPECGVPAYNLFSYYHPWNVFRRKRYDDLGIDWETKRLYYYPTKIEVLVAINYWNNLSGKKRICLQWQGGGHNKFHPQWANVLQHLDFLGHKVAILNYPSPHISDQYNRCPIFRDAPLNGVRSGLSLAATADLFIGFDSGPLYAALGCMVPSVGLFPNEHPESIFAPLRGPEYSCLIEPSDLSKIPISKVIDEIDRLLCYA